MCNFEQSEVWNDLFLPQERLLWDSPIACVFNFLFKQAVRFSTILCRQIRQQRVPCMAENRLSNNCRECSAVTQSKLWLRGLSPFPIWETTHGVQDECLEVLTDSSSLLRALVEELPEKALLQLFRKSDILKTRTRMKSDRVSMFVQGNLPRFLGLLNNARNRKRLTEDIVKHWLKEQLHSLQEAEGQSEGLGIWPSLWRRHRADSGWRTALFALLSSSTTISPLPEYLKRRFLLCLKHWKTTHLPTAHLFQWERWMLAGLLSWKVQATGELLRSNQLQMAALIAPWQQLYASVTIVPPTSEEAAEEEKQSVTDNEFTKTPLWERLQSQQQQWQQNNDSLQKVQTAIEESKQALHKEWSDLVNVLDTLGWEEEDPKADWFERGPALLRLCEQQLPALWEKVESNPDEERLSLMLQLPQRLQPAPQKGDRLQLEQEVSLLQNAQPWPELPESLFHKASLLHALSVVVEEPRNKEHHELWNQIEEQLSYRFVSGFRKVVQLPWNQRLTEGNLSSSPKKPTSESSASQDDEEPSPKKNDSSPSKAFEETSAQPKPSPGEDSEKATEIADALNNVEKEAPEASKPSEGSSEVAPAVEEVSPVVEIAPSVSETVAPTLYAAEPEFPVPSTPENTETSTPQVEESARVDKAPPDEVETDEAQTAEDTHLDHESLQKPEGQISAYNASFDALSAVSEVVISPSQPSLNTPSPETQPLSSSRRYAALTDNELRVLLQPLLHPSPGLAPQQDAGLFEELQRRWLSRGRLLPAGVLARVQEQMFENWRYEADSCWIPSWLCTVAQTVREPQARLLEASGVGFVSQWYELPTESSLPSEFLVHWLGLGLLSEDMSGAMQLCAALPSSNWERVLSSTTSLGDFLLNKLILPAQNGMRPQFASEPPPETLQSAFEEELDTARQIVEPVRLHNFHKTIVKHYWRTLTQPQGPTHQLVEAVARGEAPELMNSTALELAGTVEGWKQIVAQYRNNILSRLSNFLQKLREAHALHQAWQARLRLSPNILTAFELKDALAVAEERLPTLQAQDSPLLDVTRQLVQRLQHLSSQETN
jgi:hypothetical protein